MRQRGNHIHGRLRGEAFASQDCSVEVIYAISTMASPLVRVEGPNAASESGTSQYTPGCCASLHTYQRRIMASPS